MIELVGICLRQGEATRLERCSLAVRTGEVFGVVGPTGSGKSAVLEICAGARRPDKGRVVLEGRELGRAVEALRSVVAWVSHETPGPLDLPVRRWLSLWGELDGAPRRELPELIGRAAEALGLPLNDRPVDSLSRGELRRLALVRGFARHARLLLLDSPSEGLDGDGLRRLTRAIEAHSAEGRTVMIADAAPHLVLAVCDRVVHLNGGRAVDEVSRGESDFAQRVAAAQGWST